MSQRCVALAGCSGRQAEQSAQPEFSGDRIKADVAYLADDRLEGRFTGSPGYDIAAKYVADRFAELGLTPGNNGNWYQQVPFAEAKRKQGAPSYIRIGDQEFANGGDVVMTPNGAFPDQSIDADAVFVGYGIDGPEIGSNDYEGLDVRGKIAVVLYPFPKGAPSETAAHLLNEKAAMAKKHGAIGLLSIHTPLREKVIKWELMGQRVDQPDVKWIGDDGQPRYPGPNLPVVATLGPKAAEALFEGRRNATRSDLCGDGQGRCQARRASRSPRSSTSSGTARSGECRAPTSWAFSRAATPSSRTNISC